VLNDRELSAAIGSSAYDADGDKIGTVEHFFVDDRTGTATWVAVTTGLFGTRHSVIPALDATFADGGLRLAVQKHAVKAAPSVPDTGHLDPATEAELRRHYGLGDAGMSVRPPTERTSGSGPEPVASPPTVAVPASSAPRPPESGGRHAAPDGDEPPGPVAVPEEQVAAARAGTAEREDTDREDTHGAMTRSEERLRVDTERVASGRVRLVKYVVTEEVQVTVPIRREEVRLEELPLEGEPAPAGEEESLVPSGTDAGSGTATGSGLPDEIVLHAERPVVSVEVVPVERVRLRTEEVVGEERISDRVQREQIILDRS